MRSVNDQAVKPNRAFILYWMVATRRTHFNYALDRALDWAAHLNRPLLVLEALRVDYPFASDRLHRFILDGMRDQDEAFAGTRAHYYPYVEGTAGAGRGLLTALAADACVVITDDFPAFFLPRMLAAAGEQVEVLVESVDSNGLLPIRSVSRAFVTAFQFRRYMQRTLRDELVTFPAADPLRARRMPAMDGVPRRILQRWRPASRALLDGAPSALARLPIDHRVPVAPVRGGSKAARSALRTFVDQRLSAYHERRQHPDADGTSRLSPYLHFGHLASHEVFNAIMRKEKWSASRLGARATGARRGWWGVGLGADAYLDQLVVWRELGYTTCAIESHQRDRYERLPAWARATLEKHAVDRRPARYTFEQLERAETADALWNAAQRQLRREGWFHNYLRMLWGKKILEWSTSPKVALQTMEKLMDRWSLDGRDPNSDTGYLWTCGRYDRPWPERPVFGTVRSMSSDRTRAKVDVSAYLEHYGPDTP